MTEKPVAEWARKMAESFDLGETATWRLARDFVAVRERALNEACRKINETHGCGCEDEVRALIERSPS